MDEHQGTIEIKKCYGRTKKGHLCKNVGHYKSNTSDLHYCRHHTPKLGVDCIICLNELYNPYVLPCGHRFHNSCIRKWIKSKNSCPICRESIFTNINTSEYKTELFKYKGPNLQIAIDIAFQSRTIQEFIEYVKQIGLK